ncbi:MAG: pro-sigmaK processing inhibitor BofA family protein [Bacilli bacterium]|nr:pro-sigmaK processing inhibitor BofA family protein [Bacilli bacterium]
MLKKLYKFFKNITLSFFMLYGYNILVPAKAIIPINLITITLMTIFKLPALLILIMIKILIY